MNNIFECSKRTTYKILRRMNLGCFNCGWKEDICDLHHINPQSRGGTDEHSNLTYLCPNCHRLAHRGKLHVFKTLETAIGDSWKNFVDLKARTSSLRVKKPKQTSSEGGNLSGFIKERYRTATEKAVLGIEALRKSQIDFSKYGWIQEAAEVLHIQPQSVKRYLKKYDPDFLEGCFLRG